LVELALDAGAPESAELQDRPATVGYDDALQRFADGAPFTDRDAQLVVARAG
jgi:hypothetical protein